MIKCNFVQKIVRNHRKKMKYIFYSRLFLLSLWIYLKILKIANIKNIKIIGSTPDFVGTGVKLLFFVGIAGRVSLDIIDELTETVLFCDE